MWNNLNKSEVQSSWVLLMACPPVSIQCLHSQHYILSPLSSSVENWAGSVVPSQAYTCIVLAEDNSCDSSYQTPHLYNKSSHFIKASQPASHTPKQVKSNKVSRLSTFSSWRSLVRHIILNGALTKWCDSHLLDDWELSVLNYPSLSLHHLQPDSGDYK